MTKAFNDPDFMTSHGAQPVRIMAEYFHPKEQFERFGVRRAVIFFGSARTRRSVARTPDGLDYYEAARELAARVARWTTEQHRGDERFFICTGGGPGIMEASNRGACEVNQELSMGLNIALPFEQHSNGYLNKNLDLEFHYFFMRKFWFLNLASGLVIFPGGFGTMDELFEVLTLVQTGKKSQIPVVLFGRRFWERLVDFELFVEQGLILEEDLELFRITENVDAAFEFLQARLAVADEATRR